MNLREFARLLRARWVTITVTTLALVSAAVIYTLLTTPLYEASTRLFVSTTSGGSVQDVYQGNLFSQERVLSYAELIKGETLAQRTVDKLDLAMSADALQAKVTASVKPSTVLIDVDVLDESAVRARDIANALSDEFVGLVNELETPKPGAQPDARVVVEQRASIPKAPVIPNPVRNVAIGLVLGGLLGIGIAVVRDLLDNTVKSQETLEEITNTGVVGYIPADKEFRKTPAISFPTDNSGTAEAFRKLRTNLQFLAVDNPPRLIVITSPSPNEGKSTTAINIALALAEAEHNVLLVDGDMRRPSLAKYLDLVGQVGFSTVLSGAASVDEVIQKTQCPQLSVLAAGAIPPNPSELLGSMAAKKLLNELRGQFDYVIVDSSPLLAVTDGAVLAANADGALIVSRFGETKREQLAHAIGILTDVGATLLGSVLTMIPTRGSASYRYSYSYSYSQSYNESKPAQAPKARPAPTIPDTLDDAEFRITEQVESGQTPEK
ncbi:polysaccharide biosynthesis tyrosine autokinase [Mycobacterium sp. NBC_00419]|uniref:polysaccharide biosynthesis tyrosine autokinase n=1 Tax=Mycobacterium sp. NBC_00419 TaxID=2975989 RepID=UPI002E1F47B2